MERASERASAVPSRTRRSITPRTRRSTEVRSRSSVGLTCERLLWLVFYLGYNGLTVSR
jgi:hypothetical protein